MEPLAESGMWSVFLSVAFRLLVGLGFWHAMEKSAAEEFRRSASREPSSWWREALNAYRGPLALCGLLIAVSWAGVGTHQEEDESGDPLRGGTSITVTDYKASNAERARDTLPFGMVTLTLALHATYCGRRRGSYFASS